MRMRLTVGLLTVLCQSPLSAANVTLTFQAVESHTLPGVPVPMELSIANNGPERVHMAPHFTFEVTDASGHAQVFVTGHESKSTNIGFTEEGDPSLDLPAGRIFDFDFPVPDGHAPLFDMPAGVSPGRILARVRFTFDGVDVWSNQVPLTIDQPSGDDAAVWHLMTEEAKGPWLAECWLLLGSGLASRVLHEYPMSRYAPYFALVVPTADPSEAIPYLDAALAGSKGVLANQIRLSLVYLHTVLAERALATDAEAGEALRHTKAANALLDQVAASSSPHSYLEGELDKYRKPEILRYSEARMTALAKWTRQRNPPQLHVVSATITPAVAADGGAAKLMVTLSAAAPTGRAEVALSSDSASARVPATLTVNSGDRTGSVVITISKVNKPTTVTVVATLGNRSASGTLTLMP